MAPMLGYYFNLALRSFRRNKVLTALMVLAIALGIGAAMTTLTVYHVLSGDPLPGKSQNLYYPQIDPQTREEYRPGGDPPGQLTRLDAETLLKAKRADRQALMTGGGVAVQPQRAGLLPFAADSRYTSADFFPMFDVPFLYGSGWDAAADEAHARDAVISSSLNEKVFGGGNSVGKTLRLDGTDFRVVGVLAKWRPVPKFYDLNMSRHGYGEAEQVFLPFTTSRDLKLGRSGSMDCFDETSEGMSATDVGAPCTWIQFWVQLDTPQKARDYKAFLENYSDQQRAAGRFQRPNNVQLRDLMGFLRHEKVVPDDVNLQMWLAFGFLLVCLVNTVGLLLAKFMRRSAEIGVRRALGASRSAIFMQCLIEAVSVGLVGGVLGLGLAFLGLWAVRQQPVEHATLAHLDPVMLLTTFALAIVASLFAGALPAWRACQVTPAIQLKTQ
ncbi:putative ABC transport system permease protein [Lysobacter niabensis]|uniref:ABC transport system permease protein n=2 Tax=Agrilutibacter niabensis TaxID=380628 RepID=A0ABU1VSY0_9GAMM|nr:putative ABC transport system permease protein [Lysobacter niabensis]